MEAIREAADNKWVIVPGLVFFIVALVLSLSLEIESTKDLVPGMARNLFSVLIFVAAAMIWGGANNLLRFFRVYALSHLGDLLFLFPVHLAPKAFLPLYFIWCIALYAVFYYVVLKISPLKAAATSIIAMLLSIYQQPLSMIWIVF